MVATALLVSLLASTAAHPSGFHAATAAAAPLASAGGRAGHGSHGGHPQVTQTQTLAQAKVVPSWLVARHDASAWRHMGAPHPSRTVELLLALKARDPAALERRFWRVADPSSPEYGAHAATTDEIAELGSRPSARSLRELRDALLAAGLPRAHWRAAFPLRGHGDFLPLRLPAALAARVFGVPLGVYEHRESGAAFVRAATARRPWVDAADSSSTDDTDDTALRHPFGRWVDFVGGLETHLPSEQMRVLAHAGRGGLRSGAQQQQQQQLKQQDPIDMDDSEDMPDDGDEHFGGSGGGGSGESVAAAAAAAAAPAPAAAAAAVAASAPAPQAPRRRLLASSTATSSGAHKPPPLYDGPHAPAGAAHQVQFANPLAWRGANISALVLPRCKDGSLAPAITGCGRGMGLRTLRLALVPDDAAVPPRKDHFACDGNEYVRSQTPATRD